MGKGTARPSTKDDAAKKTGGGGRKAHPHVNSKDTKVYPFTATPPDFDFGKHAPLKKKDFADEHQFYSHKAEQAESVAKNYRGRAEEAKKMGSGKSRAKAKRLKKMQEQMAVLTAQLKASGMDVDAILAEVKDKD